MLEHEVIDRRVLEAILLRAFPRVLHLDVLVAEVVDAGNGRESRVRLLVAGRLVLVP